MKINMNLWITHDLLRSYTDVLHGNNVSVVCQIFMKQKLALFSVCRSMADNIRQLLCNMQNLKFNQNINSKRQSVIII